MSAQHLVPANKDFETGQLDCEIVCGSISKVIHANLLQLMAKYETVDVLEMLVNAHRAGSKDTFEVIRTAGLSTRVTAAFRWAAAEQGVSVEALRADFNVVARENGRSESIDYRVEPAERAVEAAAARARCLARDTLLDVVEHN